MKFVDTHCHIHDLQFFNNEAAEAALSRAIEEGVDTIICIATTLEDSKRAIAFATKHPKNCRASIGIHPHEAADMTLDQIHLQLTELSTLAADPMVVAVGECGFDFFYNKREACLERQTQLLEGQLLRSMLSRYRFTFVLPSTIFGPFLSHSKNHTPYLVCSIVLPILRKMQTELCSTD